MRSFVLTCAVLAAALFAGPAAHATPRPTVTPNTHSPDYAESCNDTLVVLNDKALVDSLGGGDKGQRAVLQRQLQAGGPDLITGGPADPQYTADTNAGAWLAYRTHHCPPRPAGY